MKIYTRKGDDGTTGLLFGGRVAKSSARIEVNGTIDEAQATLGLARAESTPNSELDEILIGLARDLYCVMAEVATAPANRHKLVGGSTLVTEDMVTALEDWIDDLAGRFEMPKEFVIPGGNRRSAALDVSRTVVRRAERRWSAGLDDEVPSCVGAYLNRLSDLLWAMARWQDGEHHLTARSGNGDEK